MAVGAGAGIFLIAIGAILTWAVKNPESGDVNVHVIGVILMCAGVAGVLLSLLFWESWVGPGRWVRRRTYAAPVAPPAADPYAAAPPAADPYAVAPPAAPYVREVRRTTYVEEERPPPGPPAPPPPPDAY
ncbi:MAG: hypothetical protein ABR521_08770 [Gaiellaceae bacterium]